MNCENLNEEELQLLEDLGGTFFNAAQCAIVLQRESQWFQIQIRDSTTEIYQRYHRGRLLAMHQVRKNALEMAKNGSSPAQSLVEKFIKDHDYEEALHA